MAQSISELLSLLYDNPSNISNLIQFHEPFVDGYSMSGTVLSLLFLTITLCSSIMCYYYSHLIIYTKVQMSVTMTDMSSSGNARKGIFRQDRHLHLGISFFLFKIFCLFIFRERGKEEEREGEKHQCVVASHTSPTGDPACNPGLCPDWESNQRPLCLQAFTQSTEPPQPGCL